MKFSGMATLVSEILLIFKIGKISFWTMDFTLG